MEKTMEKIVALAKNRGFVYPGSEIYGGLANTWDYGNLGVELKNPMHHRRNVGGGNLIYFLRADFRAFVTTGNQVIQRHHHRHGESDRLPWSKRDQNHDVQRLCLFRTIFQQR